MTKYTYYIVAIVLLIGESLAAQSSGLVNHGAQIKISNANTTLRVVGKLSNQNNGTISNQGTLLLGGNFSQTAGSSYTGNGELEFDGNTDQMLETVDPISINNLTVNNGEELSLSSTTTITNQLDLSTNGKVKLGTNELILASGGTIVNAGTDGYVITDGTGGLTREVANSNVAFPVGNASYNPVVLTNAGTVDNFKVRVEDELRLTYPAGMVITDNAIDRTWNIEEELAGGSDVTASFQWHENDELTNFDRTNCGVAHFTGGAWDASSGFSAASNVAASTWSISRSGLSSFSPFAVQDSAEPLPIELSYFKATKQGDRALLRWLSATERDNRGYHIEHSRDGLQFEKIGWITGAGTSLEAQRYQFWHNDPALGDNYYRLAQEDFDGTIHYSPIRILNFESDFVASIFPNPLKKGQELSLQIQLDKTSRINIQLVDIMGKVLYSLEQQFQAKEQLLSIPTQDLNDGIYFLAIIDAEQTRKLKLQILKN